MCIVQIYINLNIDLHVFCMVVRGLIIINVSCFEIYSATLATKTLKPTSHLALFLSILSFNSSVSLPFCDSKLICLSVYSC